MEIKKHDIDYCFWKDSVEIEYNGAYYDYHPINEVSFNLIEKEFFMLLQDFEKIHTEYGIIAQKKEYVKTSYKKKETILSRQT